ncbi:MAG: TIGR03619 family F420-dependent LLM class oxidoreductase [Actinomycetota bacterium]|nr:TIGR03619 family F420-dependent LLM class oxidoreductase [Actinomycetota bacterium]
MDVGIGLPNPIPGTSGEELLEWARRADARGFSTLATIDRIAYPSYESMVVLAAAAAVTSRIGLLTNILLAPTRDPVLLAKQAASVDQLSGGRFTLGLGVGGRPDDYEATGQSFHDRGRRMDHMLEVMQGVWSAGPAASDGGVAWSPLPVRDGGVPLLLGGMVDQSLRRVTAYGVGWTASGMPPEQIADFVQSVRQAWRESGREGSPRIVALTYFSLGDDTRERSEAYLRDYYAFLGDWAEPVAQSAARSPDDVRARLSAFREVGADELVFDPTVADPEQVDRLADAIR